MKLINMRIVERVTGQLKAITHASADFLLDIDDQFEGNPALLVVGDVFDSLNPQTGTVHRVIAIDAVDDRTIVVERYTGEHADAALRLLDES